MLRIIKILMLIVFAFELQASSVNEEHLDIRGKSFSLSFPTKLNSEIKEEIKNTLILSFLEAYKPYTKEQLKINFPSKEEWLKATFDEEIQDFEEQKTPINLLLIKHNSKVVAVASTEPEKNISNCLYIRQMGVHPDYVKQGIGKEIVKIIQEKNPEICSIVLMTRVVNQNADSFYKALGFKTGNYHHDDYSAETYTGYQKNIER